MRVDVVMCTWNSNKPYFTRCLNSIKREIPVHHFILVDRFSSDGTVEAVRKVFPNVRVRQSNARLAFSRKVGIELVDTEFFLLVDSDIELCKGWFKQIVNHLDSKTGAIVGTRVDSHEHLVAWVKWLRHMLARFKEAYAGKVVICTSENLGIVRGEIHNNLVRTCLVKDYKPPAIVSAFEDHLFLLHVVRKGYVWKTILDPIATHYEFLSFSEWLRKGRWGGAGARLIKYEKMSIWSVLRASLIQIVSALIASLQTKQPMILPYLTLRQLAWLQGWVNWNKYSELKRQ